MSAFVTLRSKPRWPTCQHCGSTLAGRRERTALRFEGGQTVEVEIYRCRCGRGRHVRREAAAA